jgi:hypothetical protein
MKNFYSIVLAVLCLGTYQFSTAQVGPNLLGAKGTFSTGYVTPNTKAASCTNDGKNSYSPKDNIGNALTGCSTPGAFLPCSDYTYSSASAGLGPEGTYSIIKNIGDANGGNCIKGDWRAQDHTGDGGWFMAVNGAPDSKVSPVFYQIKSIPVCIGTTYEFSAWVINVLPKSSSAAKAGSEPNISFKVNGVVIGNSGAIQYNEVPVWVKVTSSFTATTNTVDLQVTNATAVASGNDLGLDDISFNVANSNISITGPNGSPLPGAVCENSDVSLNYIVTDIAAQNIYYKWQKSIDGGATFADSTIGAQTAAFTGTSYTLPLVIKNVSAKMNGYKYRLVAATSAAGLGNADCANFNEYTLIVNSCGLAPVTLTSFNGRYSNGVSYLDWQTSQELNSDRFEIYRSYDGQDFSLIGSVKSAGNSSLVKNYTYQDNNVSAGDYVYYRLKQIDQNGKFVFTPIIKIAAGSKTAGIEVFPNPFISNFTASFSANKTADATLILRNTIGQPVFQKTIRVNKGNNSIQVSNMPVLNPGVYYLTIANDDINYNSKLQKR